MELSVKPLPAPLLPPPPASPLFKFQNLNGGNYHDWRFRMQMLLVKLDLWDVVSGDDPRPGSPADASGAGERISTASGDSDTVLVQKEDDSPADEAQRTWDTRSLRALAEISSHLSDMEIVHVRRCRSGKEAWDNLAAIYAPTGLACQVFLSREFNRLLMEEGADPRVYINRLIALAEQLEGAGLAVADDVLAWKLLNGLPPSFGQLVAALRQRRKELTSASVISTILQEDTVRRQERAEAAATLPKITQPPPPPPPPARAPTTTLREPGPLRPAPSRDVVRADAPDHEPEAPAIGAPFKKNAWYLQTSMTHHISPRRSYFATFETISPVTLSVCGTTYSAVGCGDVSVLWETGQGKAHRVLLRNVFYVPDAPASFLSIAQLSERGLSFSFQKASCIVEQKDGTIAARGMREGGAYRLLTKRVSAEHR